jgi:hypothetical protein
MKTDITRAAKILREFTAAYASDQILAALEDGNATPAAHELRLAIRLGWADALKRSGMPDDQAADLEFPSL